MLDKLNNIASKYFNALSATYRIRLIVASRSFLATVRHCCTYWLGGPAS